MQSEPISPRRRALLVGTAATALAGGTAVAAEYPSRNVRIVAPFTPGATSDLLARAIAKSLATAWGVNVIVENKPGAGGVIGAETVARSAPDGHTLLAAAASIGVLPALLAKMPYVPYQDLVPVTLIGTVPFRLLVHPSVPATTFTELIAYGKANPGKITFGSGGNGTIPHMGGELLKMRAGIDMIHVPYRGGADAMAALLGGQISMTIDGGPHVVPHVKSGALRMLAGATLERAPEFPDTPTIAESGFEGFESNAWQSLWVTGGTPDAAMQKLSGEVRRILRSDDMVDLLHKMGVDVVAGTPAEAERFIKAETTKWAAVIKASGAKPN